MLAHRPIAFSERMDFAFKGASKHIREKIIVRHDSLINPPEGYGRRPKRTQEKDRSECTTKDDDKGVSSCGLVRDSMERGGSRGYRHQQLKN